MFSAWAVAKRSVARLLPLKALRMNSCAVCRVAVEPSTSVMRSVLIRTVCREVTETPPSRFSMSQRPVCSVSSAGRRICL
jgi:hypothetical protein